MSLAYCILAHKNPAQTARLLRALEGPGNVFFIHYEKRAPRAEHRELARLCASIQGVHFLSPRKILWGRFSMVDAQLEAMNRAVALDSGWTHFITLTGQDFPLQPQAALAAEMAASPGASYLSIFDPFTERLWKNVEERVGRYYFESPALEALLKVPFAGRRLRAFMGWDQHFPCWPGVKRSLPGWFQYRGGANHIIVAREAAAYFVRDPRAQAIIEWLRHSAHPDESIFQTVLFNSPFAETLINNDRRAIRWKQLGDPSPQTLTTADLPWIREQRAQGQLFARKFAATVDEAVIDTLEKELHA